MHKGTMLIVCGLIESISNIIEMVYYVVNSYGVFSQK